MDALKPVDPKERTWGGLDFFILWAGAGISLAEIWAGGMLRPMGFLIGVAAILVGHLLGPRHQAGAQARVHLLGPGGK